MTQITPNYYSIVKIGGGYYVELHSSAKELSASVKAGHGGNSTVLAMGEISGMDALCLGYQRELGDSDRLKNHILKMVEK